MAFSDDESDDGLFAALPFGGFNKNKSKYDQQSKEIEILTAKLKQAEWENIELQHRLSLTSIDKQQISLLWRNPLVTVQTVAEFIDRLPAKHKEKIWYRHVDDVDDDLIESDKIIHCLHSFVALCIKIKDRKTDAPARADIVDKLLPFAQIIQKRIKNPKGILSTL